MEGGYDSYVFFIELGLNIAKNDSYISYIVPNNVLLQQYGRKLRKLILEKTSIISIIDLGFEAFKDTVVPTTVLVMMKLKRKDNIILFSKKAHLDSLKNELKNAISQNEFLENDNYQFNLNLSGDVKKVLDIIFKQSTLLSSETEIKIGIEGAQTYINTKPVTDKCTPLVRGKNFNRYFIDFYEDPRYIVYDKKLLHGLGGKIIHRTKKNSY